MKKPVSTKKKPKKKKPNWAKEEDYNYTKQFNGDQVAWAWEFLRRNEDYQKDFKLLKSGKAPRGYIPNKHKNETEKQWISRCVMNDENPKKFAPEAFLAKKWGVTKRMHNPNLNAIELKSNGTPIEFEDFAPPMIIEQWDHINDVPVEEEPGGVTVVRRDQLLVLFDLYVPIQKQLDFLKENVEDRATINRPKAGMFLNNIRALDALSKGEKNHSIRDELFPGNKANADVTVHNCITTAKNNRDYSYRAIARRLDKVPDF